MNFKNFTSQTNSCFKVAFDNGYVVSIESTHQASDELLDIDGSPITSTCLQMYTFNNANLTVVKQGEYNYFATDIFCSKMENYSRYLKVVRSVTPEQVAEIMYKVSNYKE